jgi:hypothetical protein
MILVPVFTGIAVRVGKVHQNDRGSAIGLVPLFEKLNLQKNMNFGQAIEALKEGKMVNRSGWNGSGLHVVKQIPAVIGTDIIPKMQSLPSSAKNRLLSLNQAISYDNQMLIIDQNGHANSWVPSSSDIFAEDWEISSW